jgi:hypothetical protein
MWYSTLMFETSSSWQLLQSKRLQAFCNLEWRKHQTTLHWSAWHWCCKQQHFTLTSLASKLPCMDYSYTAYKRQMCMAISMLSQLALWLTDQ